MKINQIVASEGGAIIWAHEEIDAIITWHYGATLHFWVSGDGGVNWLETDVCTRYGIERDYYKAFRAAVEWADEIREDWAA